MSGKDPMSAFAIVNILVGAAFGQRLKALVLLPATLVASILAIVLGLLARTDPWTMATLVLVGAISLQFGYLAGAILRYLIVAARAGRLPYASRQGTRLASNTGRWNLPPPALPSSKN